MIAERRRALNEAVLIDLEIAVHAGAPPTAGELSSLTGRSPSSIRKALRDLDRAGALKRDGGRIYLSESGAAAVHALLEKRDLWSAWLEHGWRVELPDAREPDPRDVRASLGDDLTDELIAVPREQGP